MIKNNIELDVKVKCIENATTQAKNSGRHQYYEIIRESYYQKTRWRGK